MFFSFNFLGPHNPPVSIFYPTLHPTTSKYCNKIL
jgi:hypothetical protein